MKFQIGGILATMVIAASANAAVIDFNAVALRGANPTGLPLPTITEYANGNGASIGDLVPGQKAYYGTSYFGGSLVSSVDTLTFTYRPAGPSGSGLPYVNLGITNGASTGVLALTSALSSVDNGNGSFTVVYDVSTAGLAFYELVGPDPAFGTLDYSDISSWQFISGNRPLSAGEANPAGQPRGPVSDSLAILWGDSSNNYLGPKEIYDVSVVTAAGLTLVAGNDVPEPGSLALLGLALGGLALVRRGRAAT